jgi:hypothetical protein
MQIAVTFYAQQKRYYEIPYSHILTRKNTEERGSVGIF